MQPLIFWGVVVAAVALLLIAARLYDRRRRSQRGQADAGLSQGEVLDQESARWMGNYRNSP